MYNGSHWLILRLTREYTCSVEDIGGKYGCLKDIADEIKTRNVGFTRAKLWEKESNLRVLSSKQYQKDLTFWKGAPDGNKQYQKDLTFWKDNVQQIVSRPKPSKKKYTVAVEGNIGCGKSTFLNYFKKAHNVEVFPEPVDKWKDVHGFNTLEKMYNDAQRWSLAFQSYVQLTMVEIHSKESEHGIKMIERSLYSARYCFVENLYRSNLMPEVDYAVLSEFYNWIQENQDMHVDLIVYLQATPKTCQDRIRARNRHEEQSVPIEYLQSLHDLHEDWLIHQKKFKVPCPVLVINTDCDLQDMYKRFDKHKDSILLRNKENIS